ncbi:zinc knuckle CX2CX4HX4C containing protein [Tanacetum coccineum]|uniref:Zinc knuckle CX2CX4HX4C containing protein n=1 Tax=Tanacetum coccineum TaxID=301880 RepID=A0ABQ5JAN1_9ASTR
MTGAVVVMGYKRGELKGLIGNEKLDVLSGLMDQRGVAIVREGTATRVNIDESGATFDGNPKVISSPLVSPTATLIMPPRGSYDIDVAATFGVPLTTIGDLHMLINDIEAGKHDELLSEMTNDDRMETLDALSTICNSIQADMNVILNESDSMPKGVPSVKAPNDPNADDNMPGMVSPSDLIVQSVDINTKSTSYVGAAGASAKDQPKVNSNFRPLVVDPVFDGVNISIPCKVVKKAKHGLKRIMMNNKGFFFFKFYSRAGLEAVLEGGPWLIRKSLIILKKWSMDTRLLKEELTRIPIWVKLHDVPIQVFEESGKSSFARCLIEVSSKADLVDVVTIGIPSLIGEDFTKETICVEYEWRPPRCDVCKIFGHVHDQCPKKVVTPPIVSTSPIVTPTIEKTNDGFQTNWGNSLNKDNITSSNSFSALNVEEEDEEEVENVYDETANLFTKTGGSSFTAAAG